TRDRNQTRDLRFARGLGSRTGCLNRKAIQLQSLRYFDRQSKDPYLRVLVTGGAGYIGSVVTQELIRSRHKVVAYDNLSNGYRAAVPVEAEFVQGDIADEEKLDRILSSFSIEAVMHLAASIEAGESMKTPERYFRNNSANTLNLLEVMLRQGIKRLGFSSTAALYGKPAGIP